jgi:hypothetical protein
VSLCLSRETLEQNSFCKRVRVGGKFHSFWALLFFTVTLLNFQSKKTLIFFFV